MSQRAPDSCSPLTSALVSIVARVAYAFITDRDFLSCKCVCVREERRKDFTMYVHEVCTLISRQLHSPEQNVGAAPTRPMGGSALLGVYTHWKEIPTYSILI